MKQFTILLCMVCAFKQLQGQQRESLTIEQCYESAEQNYPLIKQRELIATSEQYSISNATKGIFPTVMINGQESYQSDVTEIPIQAPEMNIEKLSKHQYKVYGEIAANLYDGGVIKNQKQSIKETAKIEEQKLEVELYKLKDRVNQVFFGILMLDARLDQNELLKADIERGIKTTAAAIQNGVALKSSADALRAELLKAHQQTIELRANRRAYLEMLGLMTGHILDESTMLQKPETLVATSEINRPEIKLFEYQRKAIDVQDKMITTKNLPKLAAFFQGGYGRPALNMLNNRGDVYYITGVRLNWTISGFYTSKKERMLLDISRRNIDLQKETFLYNTNLTLKNQHGELSKLQEVLKSDDEIIQLREKITNTASVQLENGVINSNDYLQEVTAEDQAKQSRILHEIQLLMAQYNLRATTGI